MVEIDGETYPLEYDETDPYIANSLKVAYCDQLAADYAPIFYDPKGFGSTPFTPDVLAYRLLIDLKREKLSALFEMYWRRQECSWRELNKDHDHDYEQIQIQFDLKTGKKKYIVSSVGPVDCAGHGIEIYADVPTATFQNVEYITSPKKFFPWGGEAGEKNFTQIRFIPVNSLFLEGKRPEVIILNCYHAFAGVKRLLLPGERIELKPKLERLDQKILDKWYYRHTKNRFGHDISKPFEDPCVMYYPPPEDVLSRFVYGMLWTYYTVKRLSTELIKKLMRKIRSSRNPIQT